ncbi:carbon-phosphorus lyase complex subunit PhnI [Pseudodesulfovibrio sp. S3]|uniref:carbon-phosphorus lyase complex subunit PhnI n=1 Tax=unclassified Pseudodesulfovibrio TaxID=2661612 RepID=UPI000FEBCDEA|nr:carbon-phosphorus lyase complex subunit PhnI [Pseudodesulfovibrio sp. S3]MCJ2165285.1 carbon-phosphorus lyase complex subunit PhnI [Pseudodesulfovibrio sp. S3-i]RWU03335.1 carbon-phosphorus lyase complex subunit PhnI [Pseudodesulfovibrio sp. S3]
MYVAVKGGEKAIDNAHRLMAVERRGDPAVPELTVEQILQQMRLAVDRVMSEGSLYDPELAALAIKQSRGDLVEAIFLLRAYRTTLPRLYTTLPLDTTAMQVRRRVSATFKDIPGGQMLGPTFDYTHRLLDFTLAAESLPSKAATTPVEAPDAPLSRIMDILGREGLVDSPDPNDAREVGDITKDPMTFPAERDIRLQNLARGDEGFLLALGYSSQRGFGDNHPFAGEIRMGEVSVSVIPDELGFEIEIGDITVSECEMVTSFVGSKEELPKFTRGYGLSFGYNERKVMAMSLVDRSLQARDLGEDITAPSQDEEFVLYHSDNVEAQGFVQHLKLPHYVDFQADLVMVRAMRKEITNNTKAEEAA